MIPVGEEDHQLNWYYKSGALQTYGLDAGYNITPSLLASAGGYYQNGDVDDDGNPEVDDIGVKGRLAYEISNGLTAGVNISYDKAFDTRVSADLKVRFGGAATTAQRKEVHQQPVITALTSTPSNRDVRTHDADPIATKQQLCELIVTSLASQPGSFSGFLKPGESKEVDLAFCIENTNFSQQRFRKKTRKKR